MVQLNEYTLLCTTDILASIMLSNDNSDLLGLSAKRCSSVDGVKWYMIKFM